MRLYLTDILPAEAVNRKKLQIILTKKNNNVKIGACLQRIDENK